MKEKNKAFKKYGVTVTGRINPAGKHLSGYYPGELSQPRMAGRHSNSGNIENTTKIFLKKSNPKARNRQIHQG